MTKKIAALALCIWGFTFLANAQTELTKNLEPINGNSYSINILQGNNQPKSICIQLNSKDLYKKNGGIIVEFKNLERFISALNKAKNQYVKLNTTYNQKQIDGIEKDLKIKCKVKGYFMYGSIWQFQQNLYPNFHYSIKNSNEDKEYTLTMNTGELSSSDKWFVSSDGYNITFTSSKEIDDFIALFSKEEINKLSKRS